MALSKMTPRQKMINMMYLVLLAMLALNVSREVMKAFHLMEVSFENTATNQIKGINASIKSIGDLREENPAKVAFYEGRAKEVMKLATELNSYVSKIQEEIIELSGGRKEKDELGVGIAEIKNGSDLEAHANYFEQKQLTGQGQGEKLREKITSIRALMLEQLNNGSDTSFSIPRRHLVELSSSPDLRIHDIVTDMGEKKSWEDVFLIELPIAAVNTNLSRIRNECFNLANGIVNRLAQEAGASGFKFESMKAFVNPKSNFVMVGSQYEADILLVAANDQSNYKINIGGSDLPLKDGIGKYMAKANSVGSHNLKGEILMPGKKPIPFETKWTSFKPAAIVSPVNMNILYVGLDNPIDISVPGVSPSNVSVRIEGGTLTKQDGTRYLAKVNGGRKAKVYVTAKLPDGSTQQMGIMEFRIKKVPNPVARFGALGGGNYTANQIRSQRYISLNMEDFHFKGIEYKLLGYQMTVLDRNGRIKMNNLNIRGSRISLPRLALGDKIMVGGFTASGPGKPRTKVGETLILHVIR